MTFGILAGMGVAGVGREKGVGLAALARAGTDENGHGSKYSDSKNDS